MSKAELFDMSFEAVTLDGAVKLVHETIRSGTSCRHLGANAAVIYECQKDKSFFDTVKDAQMICADGQSIVWASRVLGRPLPERVGTPDLMNKVIELAHKEKYKIFFLGAKPEVVDKVAKKISQQYSPDVVAGYHHGYFDLDNEGEQIARAIADSRADILFVAIKSPIKEKFLKRYEKIIPATFLMGVGGAFDITAGDIKRAPLWVQKIGLEWAYRLLQEPRRLFLRYLITNSFFCWLVFREKLLKRS
jgi:N-acetylglucosaminyldiphosphoundecaprenol N-acetyl-beta-D-mannosaminyltransferase